LDLQLARGERTARIGLRQPEGGFRNWGCGMRRPYLAHLAAQGLTVENLDMSSITKNNADSRDAPLMDRGADVIAQGR